MKFFKYIYRALYCLGPLHPLEITCKLKLDADCFLIPIRGSKTFDHTGVFSILMRARQIMITCLVLQAALIMGHNSLGVCVHVRACRKTFWRISRVKKVGDFSCDPYVTAVLNTLLWVVYGSPSVKLQVLVLTINSTGAAFEFLYIVIYCVYAPRDGRVSSFTFSLDSVIFL